jgi:hypothetical protein
MSEGETEVRELATWYFLFHLNSSCRILCIIPASSEFRTRLINAARGRRLPNVGKCGNMLSDMAYLLFEFPCNHKTGSGPFLSDVGSKGRNDWYASKDRIFGGSCFWVATKGVIEMIARTVRTTRTASRREKILRAKF